MSTNLRIVMFPHPAEEFVPTPKRCQIRHSCGWNTTGKHFRRLLLHRGEYVDAKGRLCSGNLAFWGEWEAETLVTELPPSLLQLSAHWVHEPQPPRPCPMSRAKTTCSCDCGCGMNTDPCVFGDTFKYALCRQKKKRNGRTVNTRMQYLAPGSLIVFCGRKNGQFYLDTVFVVADSVAYIGPDKRHPAKVKCDPKYRKLTLDQTHGDLTFYRGATFHTDRDGPYSFVPSHVEVNKISDPVSVSQQGKDRCPLDLNRLNHAMGNGASQFFNVNCWRCPKSIKADKTTIRRVWRELCRQTRHPSAYSHGFVPAVHFPYP